MRTTAGIFKQLILCTGLFLCGAALAQNEFYNNGSAITVQSGALVYVQGEVVNTNAGPNIGLIDNSGDIELSGDWTNNSSSGALAPTTGTVQLYGGNELIKGSQPTTFNTLVLTGSGVKTLNVNTIVGGNTGILDLTSRPMDLNSNTLIVTNQTAGAITRTTGYIISETAPVPGYGIIQWNVGNNTGNYVFPFGSLGAVYIPLTLNVTSPGAQSTIGAISASTYPTNVTPTINNRPLPTGVADLNNNCNTEHAPRMLDRFWVINTSNYNTNPSADKQFTYIDSEWDGTGGTTNTIAESDLQAWYYNAGWTHLAGAENTTQNDFSLSNNSNYGVFTLGDYKDLTMQLLNVDSVVCYGQSNGLIQFTTNQGYGMGSYYWNGTNNTDTIENTLSAGSYTLVAQDVLGCKDTLNNVNVYQPAKLTFTLMSNDYSVCKNDAVTLTAGFSGGIMPYTISWSPGAVNNNVSTASVSQTYTPAGPMDYWAWITDRNNCTAGPDTVYINVNPLPVLDFAADKQNGCLPLTVNFSNLSAASPSVTTWLWSYGNGYTSTSQSPSYTYPYPGAFNVSLKGTSDSGCVNTITKNNFITVYPKPTANFYYTPPSTDILNPEITFHNTSQGADNGVYWDFGDGSTSTGSTDAQHFYNDTGIYTIKLIVSNIYNCYDSISQLMKISEISSLYIPNAFTPGHPDGLNDVFTIVGLNFYDFDMMIFDRWGQKLFESKDPHKGWDGRFGGALCPEGVYIYKIVCTPISGEGKNAQHTYVGHVTLLD